MGRRKSVKADNTEDLRRKESQYDSNKHDAKGGGNRGRHDSNDSDGCGNRPDRMSRAPSTKNLYRNASKSGSSFHRPSKPAESPPKGYKGFHFPGGDPPPQQQLEPLPGPRGAMPPNGSANNYPQNYTGVPPMNGYAPPRNNSYEASPKHTANGGAAGGVPLTRRASQMRMGLDVAPNAYVPPPQPNMRYPVQGNATNGNRSMNASGYQQPLPSPRQPYPQQQQQQQQQQTPPRTSIDFNQMMQAFRSLPQLPYVMTPHGPITPPPFPFPYPDPAEVYQLKQQQMQMQMSQGSGNTSYNTNNNMMMPGAAAPPPQFQQPYPMQSPMQASHATAPPLPQPHPQQMTPQRPPYGPQGNGGSYSGTGPMHHSSANMNGSSGMSPVPAPVSPFNGSGGNNAAAAVSPAEAPNGSSTTAAPLHRTTSILNRVSSFKKQPAAASPEAKSAAAASESAAQQPASSTSPSSGGSILNRVSSFKKNAPATSPSPAPSAVQAAQPSPSSVPPQHSAAAKAAATAESPSTGILRRKSFFAAAAAAVPEPELTPEEREAVLKEKLAAREQERLRLEAEHQAREEAAQKLHEQRLREMREAQGIQLVEAEQPALLQAPTVVTGAKTTPTSKATSPNSARVADNTPTSPHKNVSRASSYSFASMTTARSGRSADPQPPLPQLQKQPQSPQKPTQRAASPTPEIGDYYYKGETSGSSTASNRRSSVSRSSAVLKTTPAATTTPVEESRALPPLQPQQSMNAVAAEAQKSPTESAAPSLAATATLPPQKQLWHRCPSLVLYEIPLRCKRTTNEKGEDVIDDANFPVRIANKALRVTDTETQLMSEYPHDEFVTHRKGSTNVESKLLDKVRDVVVAGYTASVLSLDAKGLAKPTSAFDSAAWMAKQRLVMNLIGNVEKMQSIYATNGGIASTNSSIEVSLSIALVKKVSAEKATEWKVANPATRQRTFEVVDLLQPEPAVVPFRMHTSVLFGSRLDGVEYKAVASEADFMTAMAGAQSNANIVLGRLADAAAVDPENEELTREKASVFEVLTCVVRHRKEGAVALADQLKEAPRDVFARGSADDVVSSDDEDDDARLFSGFNSHNGPSNCSDVVVSCLTCIGVRDRAELWGAALERKEEVAPPSLFNTAFGGPAYTVILASIDPTKQDSVETLSMQSGMTIKLHRRPTNGSARRLIQSAKYQAGAAQKELDRPVRPSGAEQRELKTSIRKSAATLDSLEKGLAAGA